MNKNLRRAVVLGMAAITLLTGVPATTVKAADVKPIHTTVQTAGTGESLKVIYKVKLDKTTVTDGRVAVEYDPAVLEVKSNSQGIKFNDIDVNKDFTDGDSKGVAYAFVADEAKSASGTLMTVQFTAKKGVTAKETTISTKVFGINNDDAAVVEETTLEDVIKVGRPAMKQPKITTVQQTLLGVYLKGTTDENADGYVYYRSTTKNGGYKPVAYVSGLNVYWDAKVENNKTYYYKVFAYQEIDGQKKYSKVSEPVSITVKKFFGWFD